MRSVLSDNITLHLGYDNLTEIWPIAEREMSKRDNKLFVNCLIRNDEVRPSLRFASNGNKITRYQPHRRRSSK